MTTTFSLSLLALIVSALATEASVRYALRRSLLDLPGNRRSHSAPTPRGGGIGIVIAALLCALPALMVSHPVVVVLLLMSALLLVSAIGWWDDHRPLGAWPRLGVQIPAGVLLGLVLCEPAGMASIAACAALIVLVMLTAVWSINFHNFMDGINGLLGLQAVWTFAMIGLLAHVDGAGSLGATPWILAAACLGFVPFNFPRARVFMGDVGSGALGFLVAACVWLMVVTEPRWIALGLMLTSGFVIDATCTLLHRVWRRRRWYSAHREHLYQWLVRTGRSHARVVSYYMAWNLLLVAPLSVLAAFGKSAAVAVICVVALYTVGIAVWWQARRALLLKVRTHA